MVDATTRGCLGTGDDSVVGEVKESETERSGRDWQDRYCSAALGTSQTIPGVPASRVKSCTMRAWFAVVERLVGVTVRV